MRFQPSALSNPSTLKIGSTGPDVLELRKVLNAQNYSTPMTLTFDSGLDAAVKFFQQKNGLKVDGIVGPNTWAALLAKVPANVAAGIAPKAVAADKAAKDAAIASAGPGSPSVAPDPAAETVVEGESKMWMIPVGLLVVGGIALVGYSFWPKGGLALANPDWDEEEEEDDESFMTDEEDEDEVEPEPEPEDDQENVEPPSHAWVKDEDEEFLPMYPEEEVSETREERQRSLAAMAARWNKSRKSKKPVKRLTSSR